ncbi:ABC transporter ATP-binding protein [Mycobacterium sp. NAZ190054]|uniref:oligopeptide/dipeptide ABC transporter ATP-binding protein n=1 Tax=Mycobacterium sp. NAZ190054 TaxID=1747766 RepID=UPI000799064B|nr:ABC transporter ATP-binding protein [Mycobacterium sp. NAZ190054]KWX57176.1 hypothetical protein ASJ79_12275 [Mycobacterium sp. NAZ190054]
MNTAPSPDAATAAHLAEQDPASTVPILEAVDLRCEFGRSRFRKESVVHAINGVNLQVFRGETVGIVGESGSGKSTLAKALLGLVQPVEGAVRFEGDDIGRLSKESRRHYRRSVQAVFQDPGASLNPRKTVGRIVGETMMLHGLATRRDVRRRVGEVLDSVSLSASYYHRLPDQLSGGQKQRVAIARAMSISPQVVIADEALSALDVSIQAQVVDLMNRLRAERNVAYVFISHDLARVSEIADRVAVMYLGRVVEAGPVDEVMTRPRHPYTKALLAAQLRIEPAGNGQRFNVLNGEIPSPKRLPSGCPFHTRCPDMVEACRTVRIEELESPQRPGADRLTHAASCVIHRQPPNTARQREIG